MSKDLQVGNPKAFRAAQSGPAATVSPGSEAVLDAAPTESLPPFVSSELDALERRAWRAFLSRHARVAQRLEADLMAHSDMPLAEFDVLFHPRVPGSLAWSTGSLPTAWSSAPSAPPTPGAPSRS